MFIWSVGTSVDLKCQNIVLDLMTSLFTNVYLELGQVAEMAISLREHFLPSHQLWG